MRGNSARPEEQVGLAGMGSTQRGKRVARLTKSANGFTAPQELEQSYLLLIGIV